MKFGHILTIFPLDESSPLLTTRPRGPQRVLRISAKSRHILDLPTDFVPMSMSPESCVEFLDPLDMTAPRILINVRFTRFQHRTIERLILRVPRLPCETLGTC